LSNGGPMVVW
jgi:hypothetical protein